MANWYHWQENTLFLSIQLQPRASCDEIVGPHGEHLKIRITAPALENRANSYLIKFLAKQFAVSQNQIVIEKGEHSRIKLISIKSPQNIGILHESRFCK